MTDPQERPNLAPVTAVPRKKLFRGHELYELPPPKPLVKGIVYLDSTGAMYGGWGQMKSILAVDLMMHIANGLAWHGRPVVQGNCLYLLGEGVSGTTLRMQAWEKHRGVSADPPLYIHNGIPRIIDGDGQTYLRELLAQTNPIFTVIDTAARSISGESENDSQIMSKVLDALDIIREFNGSAGWAIHHSGRSDVLHMRGSSVLDGGLDTILQFHEGRLFMEKQRNGPSGFTLGNLTPTIIDLGHDEDGEPLDAPVLDMKWTEESLNNRQKIVLSALTALIEATATEIETLVVKRGHSASTFNRGWKELRDANLVTPVADTSDTKNLWRVA